MENKKEHFDTRPLKKRCFRVKLTDEERTKMRLRRIAERLDISPDVPGYELAVIKSILSLQGMTLDNLFDLYDINNNQV